MAELKKTLGLGDVFALSSGAMISSGLFILPAIAYAKAGPAVIVSYVLASLLVLPSMLSKAELATAMPRSGGTYFFVERSLGTICGLFGGLASWFSLALKSAFAVVGMALLIKVVVNRVFDVELAGWQLKAVAVICCGAFTVLNVASVRHAGRVQVLLVAVLLVLLGIFVAFGGPVVELIRFERFMAKGWSAVLATSGLVFVSFGGLTKVASVAEEIRRPGRNLPLGMLLAWAVVSVFYMGVIFVVVGVLPERLLAVSDLPVSAAAELFMGRAGYVVLAGAAVTAFLTTANGGILAASRTPLAMSRDRLLPEVLGKVHGRLRTPYMSVLATGGFMMCAIVLLDIESLIKTASTLMILLFMLENLSVVVMRESKIQSYRPKFRSPGYPWVHLAAVGAYSFLLVDMGATPLLISSGFVVVSGLWYFVYVSRRVDRASAAMHIVERVTDKQLKTATLENELRDIVFERDEIIEDRFDRLIRGCEILDLAGERSAAEVFGRVAEILSERLCIEKSVLLEGLLEREAEGSTVIQSGLAIPHVVVAGKGKFDVVPVRAADGIRFPHARDPVRMMFVLAGSVNERNYHLRALMAIAQVVQEKGFTDRWLGARDTETLRNLILLSARQRSVSSCSEDD